MATDSDQNAEPDWLRNLPVRSEDIGFSPDQLVTCDACGKPNAPNREACLYCGAAINNTLPARLDVREPEQWESGFNVILERSNTDADLDTAARELAAVVGLEASALSDMLRSGGSIPLARVAIEPHAITLSERLNSTGLITRVVADEQLQPKTPPTRLRSIDFNDEEIVLTLFHFEDTHAIRAENLVLLVKGAIFQSHTESVERKKWRSKKMLRETSVSSDEPVIDIYSKNDSTGWRIHATGFDFSCLGPDKSLLVGTNMAKIVEKLVAFAPDVKVIDDYVRVRSSLESCWPSEGTRDRERLAVGGKDFANRFTTNNLTQLTKYSRLQWHLL